jgi:hypothetical protein
MNPAVKNKFIEIISALFILLFTYTAISKILDGKLFYNTLLISPLLHNWSSVLSWLIPAVELITAIVLFIPPIRWAGLYLSLALMLIFTIYIAYMLYNQYKLPCSCGGVFKILSWKDHLLMNTILTIFAFVAVIFQIKVWGTFKKVPA